MIKELKIFLMAMNQRKLESNVLYTVGKLLNAALSLDDIKVPPGNRLEVLKGTRKGQHSIRINDQYRICFIWTLQGASEVEIVDYH
jgi:plasmid maintenance system killer protein